MSQELDAPKMPAGNYPELSPNPNSEGLKLKDGGRGTPVVVTTEPRKSNTNTITVDEVKRLIREGIDHFEKEEGGVTESEMESYVANAIASKADKVGGLPCFSVEGTDNVLTFITTNHVDGTPIIFRIGDVAYIGEFRLGDGQTCLFEFDHLLTTQRFSSSSRFLDITNKTFIDLFSFSSSYRDDYALEKEVSKIHNYAENTVLTQAIWSQLKTGDILKVNHMQFIIDVFETTGEGAYKGVTGTMVGAVTANSITIASIDWRTVGEGYTELEPTLTTLTIPSAE